MFQRLMMFVPLAVLGAAASAHAGAPQKGGYAPYDACGVQYVQKTIYTPQWVTETRRVLVTQYAYEQREVIETVYRSVPETQQVERRSIVMVPQTHTKIVPVTYYRPVAREVERQYTVQVPEWTQVERQYTVMVPELQTRQGVRQVCHWVEEQVPQTVYRDVGHWEVRMVEVPCRTGRWRHHCRVSCCDPCCVPTQVVCQKVWVPNIVQEQVMVTVCRPQIVEEPYEYQVTVHRPETRTALVDVCQMRTEVRSVRCMVTEYEPVREDRQVAYTVCVPQERRWIETVTHYRQVPEQVRRLVTVCVPRQVEHVVQVPVCRMVAQTVQVPVHVHCRQACCL
jgi:hypothetical protein